MFWSRRSRLCPALLAGLAIAACGSNPVAPSEPPSAAEAPALRIAGGLVVTLTQGGAETLRIEARDANGTFVEQPAAGYTWTSSNPALVTAAAGVVRAANAGYGQTTITARSADGTTTDALVWVQPPAHVPSTYRITLQFSDEVPQHWRAALRGAADRWQNVIRTALPAVAIDTVQAGKCNHFPEEPPSPTQTGVVTGTRIYVSRNNRGTISAAPCLQRPMPHPTAIYGRIYIGRASWIEDPGGRFMEIGSAHEIGHVLGLVGLTALPVVDGNTRRYVGPLGIEGHRRRWNEAVPFLAMAADPHWLAGSDVMVQGGSAITTISIGALMDIGYPAAWYGAE